MNKDEIRKQFEAWVATLPDSVRANIADAMKEPKCPSYTFEGFQAGYVAGQKPKDAEIARVQSLHEGLMKNADKMNDELRAEIAALKALGTKFLLTIEALENDVNEETEQAWIDAYDAMKALLAKEPTAPQATGEKKQTP